MEKLVRKLKVNFTKWYIRKHYKFTFDISKCHGVWDCPIWVKPFLVFFSPTVYNQTDEIGKAMLEGFLAGIGLLEESGNENFSHRVNARR